MKLMDQYLRENEEILIEYCNKNGLSLEKLNKCPRCCNQEMMFIQQISDNISGTGLKDETPAKVLLTIKRTDAGIIFEPSEDIKEYLGY